MWKKPACGFLFVFWQGYLWVTQATVNIHKAIWLLSLPLPSPTDTTLPQDWSPGFWGWVTLLILSQSSKSDSVALIFLHFLLQDSECRSMLDLIFFFFSPLSLGSVGKYEYYNQSAIVLKLQKNTCTFFSCNKQGMLLSSLGQNFEKQFTFI